MIKLTQMLRSKKFLIPLAIVALAIFGVIVYQRANQAKNASSLPQVNIPKITTQEFAVEIAFSQKDFKFPATIFILERKPATYSESEVQNIATKLGFSSAPQKSKDAIEGDTIIYSNTKAYLVAYISKGRIEYQLNSRPLVANKDLSDSYLIKTATDFISQNNLSSEPVKFSSFVYLKAADSQGIRTTAKNEASFYRLNFNPAAASFDVITLDPSGSPVSVELLPDGSIFGAIITKLGTVSESKDKFRLKTFQEVTSSINNKEAVLVTLDQGNLSPSDLEGGAITKITFSQISLGYLDVGDPTLLQPVFILSGNAIVSGLPKEVPAVAYLPAISSR